jgi:hypothetical protein
LPSPVDLVEIYKGKPFFYPWWVNSKQLVEQFFVFHHTRWSKESTEKKNRDVTTFLVRNGPVINNEHKGSFRTENIAANIAKIAD